MEVGYMKAEYNFNGRIICGKIFVYRASES